MANKRILYATKKAGIGPVGSSGAGGTIPKGSFQQLHGLQSVGITTTFNLEQTFELGQLAIYENIEGIPDVSIDCEKVLDGYVPVYVLGTSANGNTGSLGAGQSSSATLIGRSNAQCDFCLAIYKDSDELATAGGTSGGESDHADSEVMMSGVFINSVSYNIGIDGYATESTSLVGQDKIWHDHTNALHPAKMMQGARAKWNALDFISSEDSPLALRAANPQTGSGGVNRREDVMFEYHGNGSSLYRGVDVNGSVSGMGTVLPRDIPGVSASGTNDLDSGQYGVHLQSFNCSVDLGREDIFELGRRGRYHRFVPFPTEVSCEITIVSTSGDLISASEEGVLSPHTADNISNQTIRLQLREGLLVDLGKKNKLSSVSVTGGDAGGGNEEITYSYTNFNDFTVYHPQDPLNEQNSEVDVYKASAFTPKDGRKTNFRHGSNL